MYPNRKENDPSAFCSQPSYAGETFWPLEYVSDCAPINWQTNTTTALPSRSRARSDLIKSLPTSHGSRRGRSSRRLQNHAQRAPDDDIVLRQMELLAPL